MNDDIHSGPQILLITQSSVAYKTLWIEARTLGIFVLSTATGRIFPEYNLNLLRYLKGISMQKY